MTTTQDLIETARIARAAEDESRVQRREVAKKLQARRRLEREIERGRTLSLQAEKEYLKSKEVADERALEREWFYALVSAVHNDETDTPAALFIRDSIERQTKASLAARKAADPLNLTKHTKAKKKAAPQNPLLAAVEVKDPGESVGGTVTVVKNFGESIAGRWFRTRMIDEFELQAAEWFREKYEAAQIGVIRAQDLEKPITDGGLPVSSMSDAALESAVLLNNIASQVRLQVGHRAYCVLEELIGQGRPLKEVVPRYTNLLYRLGDGYVVGLTKDALAAIVNIKGMKPRSEMPEEIQSDGRGGAVKAPKIRASNDPVDAPIELAPNRFGDMVESNRSRILRMESEARKAKAAGNVKVPAR